MENDIEDLGAGGMLIGLIILLPVFLTIRAIKFLVEPIPYINRIRNKQEKL